MYGFGTGVGVTYRTHCTPGVGLRMVTDFVNQTCLILSIMTWPFYFLVDGLRQTKCIPTGDVALLQQ